MKSKLKDVFRKTKVALTHNLTLKLISLVFAVVLWSYVNSNPNNVRARVLSGIMVNVSGQAVLESRSYALLTDVDAEIPPVRVRVEVPQMNYASVGNDSVRVELDLSGIRQAGKHRVALRGTSTYGKVTQIWPEYVELMVEEADSRPVPIMVDFVGEDQENFYYSLQSTNPSQITVSGPASLVRQIRSAQVSMDVTGVSAQHKRAERFTLLNELNEEIKSSTLKTSSNSTTVSVEVYPQKRLEVLGDMAGAVVGEPPDGYEVESIDIQPSHITVAGDQALLDALHDIAIEPVDVTGMNSTFSQVQQITLNDKLKYRSSTQVTITVNIREEQLTQRFQDVPVTLSNKSDGKTISLTVPYVQVKAVGPYSVIKRLTQEELIATVDVANLDVGEYNLPVQVTADNYLGVTFTADPASVHVVVSGS